MVWTAPLPLASVLLLTAIALQVVLIGALRSWHRQADEARRAREAALQERDGRDRRLAGRLMHANEAARGALARHFHDGICQDMVGVAMAIDDLTHSDGRLQDARTQYTLAVAHRRTIQIADRIRRISHELYPASLQLLGLAAAMKSHCLEIERRHGVEISLQADADLQLLRPDVALCLFRMAQEALRNAVAHGAARHLQVALARCGPQVELSVVDDGKGFDVEAARRSGRGLGLMRLEETAYWAGGEARITSSPGHGARVVVRVPAGEPPAAPAGDGRELIAVEGEGVESWIAQLH